MKYKKLHKHTILASTMLSAMVSTSTAHAAVNLSNPEIMDIFVALEHSPVIPPNVFLELDDSGSMNETIWFDANSVYEVPPNPNKFNSVKGEFEPLTVPNQGSGFVYNGFATSRDSPATACYAVDRSLSTVESRHFRSQQDIPFSFIENGYLYEYLSHSGGFWSGYTAQFTRYNATLYDANEQNCKVYRAFYSSRMLALKSSLAVALTSQPGYYLLDYDFINNSATDNIELFSMNRANSDYQTNMSKFLKELYREDPVGGTPTLSETAMLFNKIRTLSNAQNNSNLFLPAGKNYNGKDSLLYCKQNYAIVLSDGQYNRGYSRYPIYGDGDFDGQDREIAYHPSSVSQSEIIAGKSPLKLNFKGDASKAEQRIFSGGRDSYFYYMYYGKSYPTFSDIVFRAWVEDLNEELPDHVRRSYKQTGDRNLFDSNGNVIGSLPEFWNPENDPAHWQHITTYTIGLGLGNTLSDSQIAQIIDPYSNYRWPQVTEENSENDFARAGYVGRGGFYRADTASDLTETFKKIFDDLLARADTQAVSSAATSASQITTKTTNLLFTTGTDSLAWTGKLSGNWMYSGKPYGDRESDGNNCYYNGVPKGAFAGQLCTKAKWYAEKMMPRNESERNIFSISDKTGNGLAGEAVAGTNGIQFKYDNMNAQQKAVFDNMLVANGTSSGITSVSSSDVSKLVDFLRGDNTLAGNDDIRNRPAGPTGNIVIGDFGRGSPYYLGPPNKKIFGDYDKESKEAKRHYVFAGANDGMLHAFDANNGKEVFAYVPNAVYGRFRSLIQAGNSHKAFVDGNPVAQDIVDADGKKRTILVSGLGAGGTGLFALDVTDPKNFSEKNVLWELQDKRLGRIFAKPSIIRVEGEYMGQKNRWVIVAATGYNNIKEGNTQSGIMVIDPVTGEILQFLELPTADGLGEIAWIDHQKRNNPATFAEYLGDDGDKDSDTQDSLWGEPDRGYVGDLRGNLWVLDFSYDKSMDENKLRSAVIAGAQNTRGRVNDLKRLTLAKNPAASVIADGQPAPLFIATDAEGNRQPITTKPLPIKHPSNRGYMIYFGTGEMFRVEPIVPAKNSMYGIWDDIGEKYGDFGSNAAPKMRTSDYNLTRDRLYLTEYRWQGLETKFVNGDTAHVRVPDNPDLQKHTSDAIPVKTPIAWANTLSYGDSSAVNPEKYTKSEAVVSSGWVIDTGTNLKFKQNERIFQSPFVVINAMNQVGITFFMSTLTNDKNPCSAKSNASTWDMTFRVDSIDGPFSAFTDAQSDTNGDGVIDDQDKVRDPSDANNPGAQTLIPLGGMPKDSALGGTDTGKQGIGYVPTAVQSLSSGIASVPDDGSCNGLIRSYKVVTDEQTVTNPDGSAGTKNVDEKNICIPHPMSSWTEIE